MILMDASGSKYSTLSASLCSYTVLMSPPEIVKNGGIWGADLGAVKSSDERLTIKIIDLKKAKRWLSDYMKPYRKTCRFIAGFDSVGNAQETLELFREYKDYFEGWPLAYVAQDGSEHLPIPKEAQALFIGGSTAWKLSEGAREVIKRGQKAGLHIHIGRVNTKRRIVYFNSFQGSELFTCDGTKHKFEGIVKAERFLKRVNSQTCLQYL